MSKLLIITGGSQGIGRATIRHFQANGYHCINLSRSKSDAANINIAFNLQTPSFEPETLAFILSQIETSEHTCLIHNAAQFEKDSIFNASHHLSDCLQTNVVGAQFLNEALLKTMQANSSILYIGSTLSEKAVANTLSYIVSKHAVAGLMRASCQDLQGTGIHTACVCPGFTETEMLEKHMQSNPELREQLNSMSTMGRLVQPDEIAKTLLFCAENPVINGSIIHANLGQIEQ